MIYKRTYVYAVLKFTGWGGGVDEVTHVSKPPQGGGNEQKVRNTAIHTLITQFPHFTLFLPLPHFHY